MAWLWVLSFGVVGIGLRFAIDSWIVKFGFYFPVGTLFINVTGCFIAGLLFSSGLNSDFKDPIRLGMIVGFCGGFTTFSGFGLQFMQLFSEGKIGTAVTYGVASPVLCVLATVAGLLISRTMS